MPRRITVDSIGKTFEFPDGTPDDVIDKAVREEILPHYQQQASQPTLTNQFPAQELPGESIGPAESGPAAYLKRLEGNVRYGGDSTVGGWLLKKLGAQGTDVGAQAGTQEQNLASPVLGGIRAVRGGAEVLTGNPIQGAKDYVAGGLQAASLPLQFMGGPELNAASEVPGKVAGAIPSTERAGKAFQDVMSAAKNKPVPITDELSGALSRYQELVDRGGSQSLSVRKLMNRITDPNASPITYGEARDFASNISRLSADEYMRLTPQMKQQVGAIRVALNNAVGQAAESAGKGAQYQSAMKEYAKGAQLGQLVDNAVDYGKKAIPYAGTAYGLKKLSDVLGK